jgi:hypothetical protein
VSRGWKYHTFHLCTFLAIAAGGDAGTPPDKVPLKFDFEFQDSELTAKGFIRGRMLVHVLAGRASFRDVDPLLNAGPPMDCAIKLQLKYSATDYVSFVEHERTVVEEGNWYGHDILQPYLTTTQIPKCIEVPVDVMVEDANFPGTRVSVKRTLILERWLPRIQFRRR